MVEVQGRFPPLPASMYVRTCVRMYMYVYIIEHGGSSIVKIENVLCRKKFRNSSIFLNKNWMKCLPEKNQVNLGGKSGKITQGLAGQHMGSDCLCCPAALGAFI